MGQAGGLSGTDLKDILQGSDDDVDSLRTEVRESLEQVRAEVRELKKDMVNNKKDWVFGSARSEA